MKIIKVMRLLALTLVATTGTYTSFAAERIYPSLDENLVRDEIAVAAAIAEIKVKEAQKIINDTREQALQGKVAPAAAIKIIKEQNAIINSIESELDNKIKSAVIEVKKADEEQGYLRSFVSGVIAPFKSGYGYTPEQKATAQKVIDGLMEQQSQLTKDYEAELKKLPSPKVVRPGSQYDLLTKRYNSIIAQLNEDIHEQQLITGAAMSTERKLFWGAVAAGAAVAGMYLLAPGTEITPKVAEEIKNAVAPTPEEPKTQNIEPGIKPAFTEGSQVGVVTDEKPTLADVIESGLGGDRVESKTIGQTVEPRELGEGPTTGAVEGPTGITGETETTAGPVGEPGKPAEEPREAVEGQTEETPAGPAGEPGESAEGPTTGAVEGLTDGPAEGSTGTDIAEPGLTGPQVEPSGDTSEITPEEIQEILEKSNRAQQEEAKRLEDAQVEAELLEKEKARVKQENAELENIQQILKESDEAKEKEEEAERLEAARLEAERIAQLAEAQARAEAEAAIAAKAEERGLNEEVIRMEAAYKDTIKEIDDAKELLFTVYDQGLKMRIQEEGAENEAQFTEQIINAKRELNDEINAKLNSGADPREVLADIQSRIVETRSTLDEIAQQIEDEKSWRAEAIKGKKTQAFEYFDNIVEKKIDALGEEKRAEIETEMADIKRKLEAEFDNAISSGNDPDEAFRNLDYELDNLASEVTKITLPSNDEFVIKKSLSNSNRLDDESGSTDAQISQSLDNQVGNDSDNQEVFGDRSPIGEYEFPSEQQGGPFDEEGAPYNPVPQPVIINNPPQLPSEGELVGNKSTEEGDVNATNVGDNQTSTTSDENQSDVLQDTEEKKKPE